MATEDRRPRPTTGKSHGGMTEGQAADELLKRWNKCDRRRRIPGRRTMASEEIDEEAPPDDEGTTSEDADAGDEGPGTGEIEIDVAGEKFKLPAALAEHAQRIEAKAKEVEVGAQRKFQEAADLRKAVEGRAQQVEQLREMGHALSDMIADHRLVARRLAQFEKIDIAQLGQDDPAALTRINAEYNQLSAAKQRIEQAYAQGVRQYDHERLNAEKERIQKIDEFASKTIKDWSTNQGARLRDYALKKGMSVDQMRNALSPEFIQILDDAEFGARVRNATPQKKTAPQQKTLKPGGSASSKTPAVAKAEQAMNRLRQTNTVEDAAMALLARSAGRRK
jgi:hypothetical protein